MDFTDESMTSSDGSVASLDSHGLPKQKNEESKDVKIDLKTANLFSSKAQKEVTMASENEHIRKYGEGYMQNKKIAEELKEDEKFLLGDDKIGDINGQMKGLFDKLRDVQGKIDKKGSQQYGENESKKKIRKEGINDLMKSLSKLEKKSAFGANDAGQRLYEERTIN